MHMLTDPQFEDAISGKIKALFPTTLTNDDLIISIEKRVQMLIKITGGYNSKKVSELCGKHIIDDIKSMDSAYIRSRWTT